MWIKFLALNKEEEKVEEKGSVYRLYGFEENERRGESGTGKVGSKEVWINWLYEGFRVRLRVEKEESKSSRWK